MKLMSIAAAVASVGVLVSGLSFAYQQALPHLSEESCVIAASRHSGESFGAVVRACRDRFSQPQARSKELPQFVWSKLEGKAGFNGRVMSANLYNGDSLNVITRLRIGVTDPDTADSDDPVVHHYDVSVSIPPLSARTEEFLVYQSYDDVKWHIVKAWGYDAGE